MHSILTRRRLLRTGGLSAAGILAGCKKSSAAVTLTLGDQKGGMQSLLELSGQLTGLTYTIQWHSSLPRRLCSRR